MGGAAAADSWSPRQPPLGQQNQPLTRTECSSDQAGSRSVACCRSTMRQRI